MNLTQLEITEEEWFDIYLAHADRSRNDLIPFPEEEIQVLTNNQKGLTTARGARRRSAWKCVGRRDKQNVRTQSVATKALHAQRRERRRKMTSQGTYPRSYPLPVSIPFAFDVDAQVFIAAIHSFPVEYTF